MPSIAAVGRRLWLKAQYNARGARQAIDAHIRARRPTLPLEQVQRRLELMLAAMYERPIGIATTAVPPSPWIVRAWRVAQGSKVTETAPEIFGDSIRLPTELSARDGEARALARYRLFVIEQAERIARGTADHAPIGDALERDLYLVREGAAIDAHIAAAYPGTRETLTRERAAALAGRPTLDRLNASERGVELLLREALASLPDPGNCADDPAASLEWALETATRVRQPDETYRGVEPAPIWGTVRQNTPSANASNSWRREESRPIEHIVARKYSWGQTEVDSDAAGGRSRGTSEKYTVRGQSPEGSGHASNRQSPMRQEVGKKAQQSPAGDTVGTAATSDPFEPADRPDLAGIPPAVWYDEWNADAGGYVKRAVGVRLAQPIAGDDRWAKETLRAHAAIVRDVRQQFERLRARRTLLPRQRVGDELDLAAYVSAVVDRRAGQAPDDRLYYAVRPARRELAITLLVDASGSTKVPVTDGRSIIELEKIALLLAMEALDALGDRFAAYAFAGRSAQNVALTPIRHFDERGVSSAHKAIAALEPGGFTRLGAAMRFATHELARQSAGHRLLLILSDGRPNDVDRYQGQYGVEDSRQAILEARASGVFPFCITVDRAASEYLPRIFGTAGHTVLQRPEQLPTALVRAVRMLLRA